MGNHSNGILFNSHTNSNMNPPQIYNGDLNFYNAASRIPKKRTNSKRKDNLNILKYLDSENKKELMERDKVRIKLFKR
jgi:hypothetical protein